MKKKLLLIVLMIFILFKCIPVQALTETEQKLSIYRDVKVTTEQNEAGEDTEYITYEIYLPNGRKTGKVPKPGYANVVILYDYLNEKLYALTSNYSTSVYSLNSKYIDKVKRNGWSLNCSTQYWVSSYDFNTQTWSERTKYTANNMYIYTDFVPNSIIYNSGHTIKYVDPKDSTKYIDYQYMQDNQVLRYPLCDYVVTEGFKFSMLDYQNGSTVNSSDPGFAYTLKSFYISAYDYDTKTYLLKDINVLNYSEVSEDNKLMISFNDVLKPVWDNGRRFFDYICH